jgi:hypothetical protein
MFLFVDQDCDRPDTEANIRDLAEELLKADDDPSVVDVVAFFRWMRESLDDEAEAETTAEAS